MVTIQTDKARGGVTSKGHRVLTVLVASMIVLMGAWFVVETFF